MDYWWILPLIVAAWDVGRRFTQGRSNRALESRMIALEAVDHSILERRLVALEGDVTTIKNHLNTAKARAGHRWGA